MRATVSLSLPKDLKRWVDRQVWEGGYGTANEYLRDMLRRARKRQARRRIDDQLIEAVRTGATKVMDNADWSSIRRAARAAVKPAKTYR
jgi:antitoxin ParD1/3/4